MKNPKTLVQKSLVEKLLDSVLAEEAAKAAKALAAAEVAAEALLGPPEQALPGPPPPPPRPPRPPTPRPTTRTDAFFLNLAESVGAEEAAKSAAKKAAAEAAALAALGPPERLARPAVDAFSALEEHLRTIDHVHAQAAADARKAYLDLLARMVPARVGPSPPPDAHALALPLAGGAPPPAAVLAILREVGKQPDDLRRDVKLLTTLRDQADLASQHEALRAAERAADEEVRAVRAAFEKVEAEWLAKIAVQRRLASEAAARSGRAREAIYALERAQQIDDDLRRVRGTSAPDQLEADREAAKDARASIHERALRLAELERVFFPKPPEPESTATVVRHEGWSMRYTPQDGRS